MGKARKALTAIDKVAAGKDWLTAKGAMKDDGVLTDEDVAEYVDFVCPLNPAADEADVDAALDRVERDFVAESLFDWLEDDEDD